MCPHPDRSDPPGLYDECRVVRPHGELGLTTVAAFAHALADACSGTGRRFLIVDLTKVTFMDGSALAPLSAAWDDCDSRNGWVRLVRGPATAGLALRAGGLTHRFPRYASAQDAWTGTLG
ncbi:STAS domain-containing protein [Streptomyces justiciae]|uniref:STAS domain-containing protein n=1 Tax=Streptomyces justiciae TaxID=2780140 RepID=A0ABU3LMC8_9ACTN|nr:STAS domain-containing protein [Streptomyces justiciae]MDT7839722.1 STAS domain-containing protein [Streptomyces justiciae]